MGNQKKSSPVKAIVITLVILALIVAAFFLAKKFRVSNTTVPVYNVASLGWGPLEDEMNIDGMVYDQDSQTIYYDATILVNQVFVEEGQKVKAGDSLIEYDMESEQLAYQMAQLNLDQLKNSLAASNAELRALYNTTPIPDYVPPEEDPSVPDDPSDVPAPEDQVTKEKVEDAWTLLDGDSIEDYYLDPGVVIIDDGQQDDQEAEGTDEEGTEEGSSEGAEGEDASGDEEGQASGDEEGQSSEDSGDDATDESTHQVPDPGSIQNPYRYMVTEDGRIYGSFLNELRKQENVYAVVEIRSGNRIDGALLASLTLNTRKIKKQNPDDYWYVILHTGVDEEEENNNNEPNPDDNEGSDDFEDIPQGYTAAELAEAIRSTQMEIRDLDLEIRRAELELKVMTENMEDGVVRAKNDGVVTIAHDKDNPPQDGSPFLKVESGAGVTVQGNISELLLETIQPGQEITAYDWETSDYYTGKITKIDDYPADSRYYYGGGNPNSSYYGFLAYFEDAADLEAGHFLQMSLDANANKGESISLPNAYIRSDGHGKYVMMDVDGILTKQYIKCGKVYYAYVTEILEGLSQDDYVAFPYGDGEEEGAKTTKDTGEEMLY